MNNLFIVVSKFSLSVWGFIVGVVILLNAFLACLILGLTGASKIKNKIALICVATFESLFYLACSVCVNQRYFVTLFFMAISVVFLCPVLLIKKDDIKKEKELIEQIDNEIKSERYKNRFDEDVEIEKLCVTPKESFKIDNEVDFSHVKNIINRLDYFNLSAVDKKAVGELESAIIRAEQRGATPELKEKVNDGLSSLLKIMSKHGV